MNVFWPTMRKRTPDPEMWQVSQGLTLAKILKDANQAAMKNTSWGEIATIGELSEDDYTIELRQNNRHVTFKIDSGADVSAIPPYGQCDKAVVITTRPGCLLNEAHVMSCRLNRHDMITNSLFTPERTHLYNIKTDHLVVGKQEN